MLYVQRRLLLSAAGACLVGPAARAQPGSGSRTIALLSAGTASAFEARAQDAFRARMAELGYVDGRHVVIEVHYAEGDVRRLGQLAADLARRKVDLIVSIGTPAAFAARDVTAEIPIVMASSFDAQLAGLVKSLAQPGGNITGTTAISSELFGKRMELLREVVPGLARLGFLRGGAAPDGRAAPGERQRAMAAFGAAVTRGMDAAAERLGIALHTVGVAGRDELPSAFATFAKARCQAVYLLENPALRVFRASIAELASRHRLPSIAGSPDYTEAGCLLSYAADFAADRVKVADYVDRIFKGADPADLPVQQPTKFEMVINMNTARALGLRLPQTLLLRADRLIE